MELKLHSPAGAEPVLYTWPLTSGRGYVSYFGIPLITDCIVRTLFFSMGSIIYHRKKVDNILLVALDVPKAPR